MACTKIGYLITRFLNDQLSSKVRVQDTLTGLRAIAVRSEGNLKAWYFIRDNWNELFTRFDRTDLKVFIGFKRFFLKIVDMAQDCHLQD